MALINFLRVRVERTFDHQVRYIDAIVDKKSLKLQSG